MKNFMSKLLGYLLIFILLTEIGLAISLLWIKDVQTYDNIVRLMWSLVILCVPSFITYLIITDKKD